MAKEMKKVSIQLSLDVDKQGAVAQVKSVTESMKKILAGFEKSGGTFEVFQNLVAYLGDVEQKIVELKNINPVKFDELFGEKGGSDLNSALQSQIATTLGTTEKLSDIISDIQGKIDKFKGQKTIKIGQIREIGEEIKSLYTLMGQTPKADLDFINQKGSFDKLDTLSDALQDFKVDWLDFVNTVKNNPNPLFGNGSKNGSNNGNSMDAAIQKQIKALQKQKKLLEERKRILNEYHKENFVGLDVSYRIKDKESFQYTPDDAEHEEEYAAERLQKEDLSNFKAFTQLYNNYVKAKKELSAADPSSEDYPLIYSKALEYATQLNDTLVSICDLINSDNPNLSAHIQQWFDAQEPDVMHPEKTKLRIGDNGQPAGPLWDEIQDTIFGKLSDSASKVVDDALLKIDNKIAELENKLNTEVPKAKQNSNSGGNGDGGLGNGQPVDFTDVTNAIQGLSETVKAESSNIQSKVDGINPIETLNGIQSALNNIQANVNNLANEGKTDPKQQQIDAMKKNLLEFANIQKETNSQIIDGKHQRQELSGSIFSNGKIKLNNGEAGNVPWSKFYELFLSEAASTIGDVHTHPFQQITKSIEKIMNDSFSFATGDIGAYRHNKELNVPMSGMLTGDIYRMLDISNVSMDQLKKLASALKKNSESYAKEYPDYVQYDKSKGTTYLGQQFNQSLSDVHVQSELFEQILLKSLDSAGISRDIFQKYDIKNDADLTKLATTLVELGNAANQVTTPFDRMLKIFGTYDEDIEDSGKIIQDFVSGKIDTAKLAKDISKGDSEQAWSQFLNSDFSKYQVGDTNSIQAFRQLLANSNLQSMSYLDDSAIDKIISIMSSQQDQAHKILGVFDAIDQTDGYLTQLYDSAVSYKKGERSVYDIFNSFSGKYGLDFDKINTNAQDSITTIDYQNALSPLEQAVNEISSLLSSISSAVSAIQQNTNQTTVQSLDKLKDNILTFNPNTNDKSQFDSFIATFGSKSQYDPNNITEYYTNQVIQSANKAVQTALSDLKNVDMLGMENISNSSLTDTVHNFQNALSLVYDAMQQIYSYQEAYGKTVTGDAIANAYTGGTVNSQDIMNYFGKVLQDFTSTNINNSAVNNILPIIDELKSRLDIARTTEENHVVDNTAQDQLVSEILPLLQNINEALNNLTNIFSSGELKVQQVDQNNNGANQPVVNNNPQNALDNTDVSLANDRDISELQNEQQILLSLEQIVLRVKDAVDAKTQAFENEKLQVESNINSEIETLKGFEDVVIRVKDTIMSISTELGTVQSVNLVQNIEQEIANCDNLKAKIVEIRDAIDEKTQAFMTERETVASVVSEELDSLTKLKEYVDSISQSVSTLINGKLVNMSDKVTSEIDKTKDTDQKKTEKTKDIDSKQPEDASSKMNLSESDKLLSNISSNVQSIADVLKSDGLFAGIKEPLNNISQKIDKIVSGVSDSKNSQKLPSGAANDRLADAKQYDQIKEIALGAVSDKGTESKITGIKALADGLVQVNGYIKTAEGNYENFTVKVNAANETIGLAFSENKKLTQQMQQEDMRQKAFNQTLSETVAMVSEYIAKIGAVKDAQEQSADSKMQAFYHKYESDLKPETIQKKLGLNIKNVLKQVGGLLGGFAPEKGITGNMAEFSGPDTFERDYAKLEAYKEMLEQIGYTLSEPVFDKHDGLLCAKVIPIDGQAITDLEQARKILEDIYINRNSASQSPTSVLPDYIQQALPKLEELKSRLGEITNADELLQWKAEWDAVTESIVKAKQEQENLVLEAQKRKDTGTLNAVGKSATEIYKSLKIDPTKMTPELEEIRKKYLEIVSVIEEYKKKREALTQEEISGLKQAEAELQKNAQAYAQRMQAEQKQNEAAQKAYGASQIKNIDKKYTNLSGVANGAEFAGSATIQSALSTLEASYQRLVDKQKEFIGIDPTKEQKDEFAQLTDQYNQAYKALDNIIKSSRKLQEQGIGDPYEIVAGTNMADESVRMETLRNAVNYFTNGTAEVGKFNIACTELSYTVKNADGTFTDFAAVLDSTGTKIVSVARKTKESTSLFGDMWNSIKKKSKEILTYMVSMGGLSRVMGQIRQGVQYVKETDTALTELKKVTDETDETYNKFLKTMSQIGSEVGATTADLTNMAASWARLGYSIEEAGNLAKSTAVLLNVSEFTDADKASEALISTIQAYGYAAEDSMHVVDVLNEIGNNFAVSSDGIATALQDSASSLMAAGNDLEKSVALVAAANKVVQDPSKVGGALRTISLRIRGTSVEVLEEMGEETDGVVESVSKLQSKIKALTGVNILNDAGGYKDTYTIIKEIAEVWPTLDDMSKASALELLAGKNRSNVLAAMLTNLQDLTAAYDDAMKAQGSAEAENEKYLNSIQGKIELFTNSVQTMWTNAISSDVVKTIIDAGTALVKFVDKLGLIPSILTAIIAAKAFKILTPTISDATKALGFLISESIKTGSSIASLAKDTQLFGDVSIVSFKKVGTAIKSIGKFFVANPIVAAITAVVAVTGFAVTAYKKVKQAEEEAAEAARQYAEEIQESNKSLDKYKLKIDELRSSLDSGNLSEEEAYDARKQLITIQDELISRYGKEAEAINLVTGNIEKQKNAIDALAQSNAQAWLNENSKQSGWWIFKGKSPIEKAIEQVEGVQNAFVDLEGLSQPFKDAYGDENYFDEYMEAHTQFRNYLSNELGGNYIAATGKVKFSGKTREEIANIYDQIANWLRDYAKKSGNKVDLTSFIGEVVSTKDKLVGDKYDTYKANYDAYLENTALTSYTDTYGQILDAQDKFREAYASGDKKAAQEAKTELENAVVAAQEAANGDDRMVNWFGGLNDDFQAAFADIDFDAAFDDASTGLQSSVKKALKDLNLGSDQEILNLGNFIGDDGKLKDDVEGFTQEQADAYNTLKSTASEYGITIDELVSKLVQLGLVQGSSFNSAAKAAEAVGKTLSSYSDTLDKFTNAQSIQDEVIYDNIKLTDEQGDALKALIGDEEDYADAVDESNGYVVKNIELVQKLIAKKNQEAVQNAKTEKSQARLKYYELYKKIKKLTGANGELAQANVEEINALYKEMGAVEQTIAKYSMLEQKLLGAANAYTKFEEAQTADQEKDYGSKAEEMISSLIEGLQSAKIGTETFRAAVLGMVPEDVYSNLDTVEEKVAAIANYIKNSEFSKYFTLKFGEDGTLESAEMTLDNVQSFIESAQEKGVFTNKGDWTHFELSDDVKTLDDFCKAMGITKEMAFAMFTEIDSYDGEWLNGDFGTMLDQLDLGLEGNTFMATKTLTELDVALANNKIGVEEWAEKYQEANAKLQGCAEEARTNAVEYQNATTEVTNYKKELEQATQKLNELNKPNSGATQEEIDAQTQKVKDLTEQLGAALQKKYGLEEPTEMTIQLALEDIDAQMTAWKSNNNELAIKANIDHIDDSQLVELGEDGKYQIKPDVEITDDERQKLQQYLDLLNDQGTINLLVENQEEAKAQIEEVKTAAEAAKKAIEALPDPSIDSTAAVDSINKLIDAISLIPTGITVTTTYKEVNEGQTVTKQGGGSGGHSRNNIMLTQLNGTAHASGNWGADESDTSLVGELGPELRVRGNRWDMLGENGAEFTDVKKGDIIFNHKQTKSLLENGYINSRGKAYASGTAYGLGNLFDKFKIKKLAKYAEEMCEQYEELVNGNVDLRNRPHLSPSYEHDLAMGGGYNSFIGSDGQIYASTSAETVTIGNDKNKYTIDITPVLENGEVLTSDALAEYIDGLVTDGSTQDLLDSDKYNLVIRAVPGEYDEQDWSGFEEELSQYKDGYLDTLLEMFNLGGEKALESNGFSSVGISDVAKDLRGDESYVGKEVASAIDSTSDGMRNLDSLINQYVTDVLNAKSLADDIGTDLSQTKYGNVDADNRQELYWDNESINKYGDALDSWGMKADDLVGTYSTLLSCVGEFGGQDIAFTPILQTDSGPQLLDSDTVDKYINGLISKASQDDGQWTNDELFRLDTEGLEVDGVIVKNLLEDIGENANKTAKLLHYVGDTGAVSSLEGEIESTSSELVLAGENISAIQAKLDKLNETNISDKTFTITTEYQTIGSGTEQTVHTHGASGRLTIYADGTAHAAGDWGLPQAEKGALVGELGKETVVDPKTGKYYTVGDTGAEFVDLPKNAIIFNHKQTAELFKNGHINSRGKAYAEGNAHITIDPSYTTPTYYSGASNNNYWTDLSDAAEDLSDAADEFEEVFDWFEVLLQEIDDDLNYMSAQLENAVGITAKNSIQDQMINTNQFKLTELVEGRKLYEDYAAKLFEKIPQQYQELAKNGGVALTEFLGEANQEVVEAINNYREWAQKVADVKTQYEEVKKEITSISLQKVQTIADEYDRVITKITTMNDLIQANIDLIDEQGERTSSVMYEEMIKNSKDVLEQLKKQRADMQYEFDKQVSSGHIDVGSEAWYEGISAIQDVDKSIIDCRKDIESFQNSINQLHWDNFDKLITAIDNVGTELSNLGDLIDDDDVVDEMGDWTDKGITKMGLLAQEMERAQYRSKQYAEQIDYLNQEYAAGKYSADEYNEKLQELQDGQWDSIKSYEAAKDAIVELNKARIESAKDAMQKEIDAYSDLISKKKEELQLTKDAHDFSKTVAEQTKNIADIQKQLAALSGDNSASAIARRKKLEAELAKAQEELDETYYSHSIEQQQDALDKNLEDYQDEKDKEMEKLDEYLKNVEQVIADSFATITGNTETVAETLKSIADEYGINLSDAITSPWEQGSIAIGTYQDQLDTSISAFTQQLEGIKQKLIELQAEADKTAQSLISATNQQAKDTSGATYTPSTSSSTPSSTPSNPSKPSAPSVGSSVTVKKSATDFSRDGGNGTKMQSWVPGTTFTVYQATGSEVLIGRNGGYTGWVRLSDIEGYAKGSKKVPNDQLALVDELGDELQLVPGKNGRLEYIKKGTGIVPADLTEKLMDFAIDPTNVLERAMPKIGAPYIVNNNMELNMSFGSLVHVDTVNQDTLPELQKMVRSEFDNCMKSVNSSLRRYTR